MTSRMFIEDSCIACLGKNSTMYDLRKDEGKRKLFLTYIQIDFEKFANLNFCKNCDVKLNDCHKFFDQVNSSINYIQQYAIKKEIDTEHEKVIVIKNDEENSDENDVNQSENNSADNFEEVARIVEEFKKSFKKRRSCPFCNFMAENRRTISTHMTLFHKDKKINWCCECNDTFENISEHRCSHKNKHTCPFCNKEYSSSNYVRHLLCHAETFKCNICNKSFKSSISLKRHSLIHSESKPYICRNCGKYFTHATSFKCHLNTHGSYRCEHCMLLFEKEKDISEHNCIRDSESEQIMEIRNYDTMEDAEMRLMEETANGEEMTGSEDFCKECNKKVDNFKTHNEKYHTGVIQLESMDKNLRCESCDKTFGNNYKLRLHMRTHTGELPYKCSYCDKGMTNRSRLIDHERVHTKEKPYICSICSKGYGQRSALSTHMKQHTGKPEVCGICNKTFCRKSQLKLHVDKHMGLKPFLCNQCGRVFAQKNHLTDHLKGHGDERPYQCEYCEKAFKKKTLLKGHLKLHQDVRPFQCSFCEYSCYTAYRLQQHEKLHINEKVEEKRNDT